MKISTTVFRGFRSPNLLQRALVLPSLVIGLGFVLSNTACMADLGPVEEFSTGGASGVGGSGSGGAAAITPVTYAEAATMIAGNCATTGCHDGTFFPTLMYDDGLPGTLLSNTVGYCDGAPMVTPGDTAQSSLVMLIQTGQCTLSMPYLCEDEVCLPQPDLDLLNRWIVEGAPMQ